MKYFEQLPSKHLSNYIDKYWYCQADELSNTTMSIPFLNHELVINFCDNYSISRESDYDNEFVNKRSWISGIQRTPTISKSTGQHEMMGVLFKPFGLKPFIKYHSSDFNNKYIDARLIFGNSFEDLIQQIQNIKFPKDKISFIEKYLLGKLSGDYSPKYLKASLNIFELQTENKKSIKDTCKQSSISNKSLIKSFQKHIGITPKKYLQLHSINKAILRLSKDPKQSLTNLAYDLNFYDQAHFIRLFKATTSLTPRQYAKCALSNKIDESSPNFIFHQG